MMHCMGRDNYIPRADGIKLLNCIKMDMTECLHLRTGLLEQWTH